MIAKELKVEYLNRPLDLDVGSPRFFWKNEGGIKQTAYQIKVSIDSVLYWDSGKIISGDNTHILYKGKTLPKKSKVDYEITLWDELDIKGKTVSSYFETGITGEFIGKWITGNYNPIKNKRYPVDYFKKSFIINTKIKKARLYITSKGIYQASINGKKIESFVFAPGTTDYRKRLQYQVYDVTDFIKNGENELSIALGDGWYRGSIGCFGKTNVFGRTTAFICQLEYLDEKENIIISDESWDWSNDGPILLSDLKDGEIVDSRKTPSYKDKAKIDSSKNTFKIVSSNNVYVTKHEHFLGKILSQKDGKTLVDFGQNIAGIVSFSVNANGGEKLKIRLGEMLNDKNEFTQTNFQKLKPVNEFGKIDEILLITGNENKIHKKMQNTPLQEINYICHEGMNNYETTFSVFGFRYALIETDLNIDSLKIESIAVYSNLEFTGEFVSSDSKLNQLFKNTVWSMKNNFLDIPTDCPTRERLGWTGDGQIFFNTASYLASIPTFYRKWLHDLIDNQTKDGKISAVVPYNGMSLIYDNTGTSAGWADAAIIIPYLYYKRYNDINILEECYHMMRSSIHYMIKKCGGSSEYGEYRNYIYEKGVHLGEWLEPLEFKDMDNNSGAKVIKQAEVATAYLYNSLKIYSEICTILNKEEDRALIDEYLFGTKHAYYNCFLNNFDYTTKRQAKMVRPLQFGLAIGKTKEKLAECLKNSVNIRNGKIGTGFLSTAFLLPVLANNGYTKEAYKTLFNEESPGFMYQVNQGATTMWETWENDLVSSKDHYSFGAVSEFLFAYTLGIKLDGKNKFIIDPKITDKLSFASGFYDSIYGKVSVKWSVDNKTISLDVLVPSNCTAIIYFYNYIKEVNSGAYHFEKERGKNNEI